MRIYKTSNPTETKISEKERGGGASDTRADISLQPVEETMGMHVAPLKPMEEAMVKQISIMQPKEDPTLEHMFAPWRKLQHAEKPCWSRFLAESAACREELIQEQVFWQELSGFWETMLEQCSWRSAPCGKNPHWEDTEGLYPTGRNHDGVRKECEEEKIVEVKSY